MICVSSGAPRQVERALLRWACWRLTDLKLSPSQIPPMRTAAIAHWWPDLSYWISISKNPRRDITHYQAREIIAPFNKVGTAGRWGMKRRGVVGAKQTEPARLLLTIICFTRGTVQGFISASRSSSSLQENPARFRSLNTKSPRRRSNILTVHLFNQP